MDSYPFFIVHRNVTDLLIPQTILSKVILTDRLDTHLTEKYLVGFIHFHYLPECPLKIVCELICVRPQHHIGIHAGP
jgi:hypothetical protein